MESLLFGTMDRHSSNLWYDIQELGLESSTRVLDSQSYQRCNLSHSEFKEVIKIFNEYRRGLNPLCGVAKKCTVIPQKVAATLAMTRGHKQLLIALGQPVPDEWERLERQTQHAAEGETDLILDEMVAADQAEGELVMEAIHTVIQDELVQFDEMAAPVEDEQKLTTHNYALREQEQSQELRKQLQAFLQHRTAILNSAREGTRVMPVTAEGNTSTMLRFLGWCKRHSGDGSGPYDLRIFTQGGCRGLIDRYVAWLVDDRKVSYGSIANYLNSLMAIMSYVAAEMMSEAQVTPEMEECYAAAFNLRSQAESQAREDRMYKSKHKVYILTIICIYVCAQFTV